jgi:sigma-54 specific flagellar transcriptional regulator A
VPELLNHFARQCLQNQAQPIAFSDDFLEALQSYAWPGNVRELSNLVDRFSTLFAGQTLSLGAVPADLLPKGLAQMQAQRCAHPATSLKPMAPKPAKVTSIFSAVTPSLLEELESNPVEDIIMLAQGLENLPAEGISLKDRLAEIERDLIVQALARTDGNVSQTARLLNLQRTTLIEKLNKYDLRQGVLNVSAA